MKKWIIILAGLAAALTAGAESFRADVTADAYVYYYWRWPSVNPTVRTYGSDTYLHVDSYVSSGISETHSTTYLKFDLSNLPAGSAVGSVTLHLQGSGRTQVANINYVGDDSWTESTLYYYSQPSNQVGVADTTSWIVDTNTYWMARSLNVEAWDISQDIADGQLGLRLYYGGGPADFTAREAGSATAAYLEIDYTPPPPPVTLEVVSAFGSPIPTVGTNTYATGTSLECSVADVTFGLTRYTCAGWTLSGNDPSTGTNSSFNLTLTNNAMLTWNWNTNYWLDVSVSGSGTVSRAAGYYAAGSVQDLVATPEPGWIFMGWSGDAFGTNAASLTMNAPKTVTAIFSNDADGDGLTNTEEAGIGSNPWKSDTDDDGFDDAFEVAQGLSPTNDNSAIAAYIANRDATFGLYPSNVVLDVAVGQIALGIDGSNTVLSLQLIKSDGGSVWTNAGGIVDWNQPTGGNKKYFRVRSY